MKAEPIDMVPVAISIIATVGGIWLISMCTVLSLLYAFGERQERADVNHSVSDGYETHQNSTKNAKAAAD